MAGITTEREKKGRWRGPARNWAEGELTLGHGDVFSCGFARLTGFQQRLLPPNHRRYRIRRRDAVGRAAAARLTFLPAMHEPNACCSAARWNPQHKVYIRPYQLFAHRLATAYQPAHRRQKQPLLSPTAGPSRCVAFVSDVWHLALASNDGSSTSGVENKKERLGWSPRRTKRSYGAAETYGQYQNARSSLPRRTGRSVVAIQPDPQNTRAMLH